MMRRFFFFFCLCASLSIAAQKNYNSKSIDELKQPKLVVGLMVDQMRWDYLTRFADRYSDGGFRRLMREGYNCNRTLINYIPSITAVGHTSVYTGSVPAMTGIVGNNFFIDENKTYCTEDSTVQSLLALGADGKPDPQSWSGRQSPRHMLVTTMTDQLRLATNFRSKTIGVALKDRAAILPAGHAATAAYWMDGNSTHFITSTYYMERAPKWVTDFNAKNLGTKYVNENLAIKNKRIKGGPWRLLYDEKTYVQSADDGQAWEGTIGENLKLSPWGMTITFDMARAAIEGENLGHNPNGVPDFLAVSISSTDMIGHRVSPNSIWMEDTYLRLDLEVEKFLNYLDQQVGRGNYVLFLTADHGGSHNPVFKNDHNLPGDNWREQEMLTTLNSHLQSLFPAFTAPVKALSNMQVHFTQQVRQSNNYGQVVEATLLWLRQRPDVAYAFPVGEVPSYVPEPIRTYAVNGYCPHRAGDIQVIFQSGIVEDYSSLSAIRQEGYVYKGTTHEVWSPDDTHIPLIFFGFGVHHAWDNHTHFITDIAPTICSILNIQQPNACVGEAIDTK